MARTRTAFIGLLLTFAVCAARADPAVFLQGPSVVQNPNPAVPLAAVLSFETDQRVATTVSVSDGEREWDIAFDRQQDPQQGLALLGLRAGRTHTLRTDEETMTVRQIWASASERNEDSCNSWAMGDAHRLPITGNMLVIYTICLAEREGLQYNTFALQPHVGEVPTHTRIREYTRTNPPEVVSEILVHDEHYILQWMVYGGLHAESLYR